MAWPNITPTRQRLTPALPALSGSSTKAALPANATLWPITEERYDELLNVLPPLHWTHADGVERFLLCEAQTGRINTACAKRNGRFLTVFVRRGDLSIYPTAATFDALPVEVDRGRV